MDIPWYNQQDDFWDVFFMGFLLPVMAIWMGMIRWWLSSGFFGVYPYFQTNPIGYTLWWTNIAMENGYL